MINPRRREPLGPELQAQVDNISLSRNPMQVELAPIDHNTSDENPATTDQQLERADGGAAAWRILCAAFMFEALLWGLPISFGVFQDYYTTELPAFEGNPYVPLIGTTASGIPYLGAPLMAIVARRSQQYLGPIIWFGWLLCEVGLVVSSFVDTVPALIMSQGIMYGVGFLIFYWPIINIVNEWWIRRRGMAFGIIVSAAGCSSIAMPLIISSLLRAYGHRTTLRAIAVALCILTGPLVPLMKRRLPPSHASAVPRTNWSFASQPLFIVYCIANFAQGLGFFFPSLFLPSYATTVGLSAKQGAMLLALMGLAQMLGQWAFGILSDNLGLHLLMVVSTLIAAVSAFTLWGFAHELARLVVFALLFGFFAYGFCSLRARMGMAVSEEPSAALAMFGILVGCQGVGNVLVGPISVRLLQGAVKRDGYGLVRYKSMVIFTGACMIMSAVSVLAWYARVPRRFMVATT